jgi:hypothetical protein
VLKAGIKVDIDGEKQRWGKNKNKGGGNFFYALDIAISTVVCYRKRFLPPLFRPTFVSATFVSATFVSA